MKFVDVYVMMNKKKKKMVPRQLPPKKIAPQLGLRLVLELRQFSSGAIVLEPFRILHRQYEISFLKLRCTLRSFIFKSDLNVKHRSNFYRKTIFTEKKFFSVDYVKIIELHVVHI